jgi:formylglycine-generating enzyme required for sulfatase activity
MVDGSTRFLSDAIDPGLWHVLHSRETPPRVFPGTLDHIIADSMRVADPSIDGRSSVGAEVASTEEIENAFGMKFRRIAAGEFQMGLPDRGNDHDVPAEAPSHRVRITRSYYLGIHEVTRREYQDVMGGLPAGEPDPSNRDHVPDDPVVNVTWDEAERFCQELSAMPDERSAGRHYRLPTEAEWEYACRAGDREPYRWDRQRDPADGSGDAAGILPALPLQAVGRYPPNGFGLHDMRGNAWEWCADWFDRDYYARSPIEDPRGPGRGYIKVIRGGSWTFVGEGCKLSYPMMPPWKASPFVGFRVVCEPVGSTTPSARTGADEP